MQTHDEMQKRRKMAHVRPAACPETLLYKLSDELLERIAAQLSVVDICHLEQASRRCRAIVQSDMVWISVYRSTWRLPRLLSWQQVALLR